MIRLELSKDVIEKTDKAMVW